MVFPIDNGEAMRRKALSGFTLIELMVVMAIVGTLLSIVLPRYFDGLKRAEEATLKADLKEMREAIDYFHEDKNVYPASLEVLVAERYIKFIPDDPMTGSHDTWQIVLPPDNTNAVYDVRSGSDEIARDGSPYNSW